MYVDDAFLIYVIIKYPWYYGAEPQGALWLVCWGNTHLIRTSWAFKSRQCTSSAMSDSSGGRPLLERLEGLCLLGGSPEVIVEVKRGGGGGR